MPVVYVEKMSQTVNTGNLREEKKEGDFLRAMYFDVTAFLSTSTIIQDCVVGCLTLLMVRPH